MQKELHSRVDTRHVIEPAAHTATQTSPGIDCLGFESFEAVFHVGAAMVGGGFNCTIQESDDNGVGDAWAEVAAEKIRGGTGTAGAQAVISIGDTDKTLRLGSVSKKRWQRVVMTETGAITAGIVGCLAVLSDPENAPVADQNT